MLASLAESCLHPAPAAGGRPAAGAGEAAARGGTGLRVHRRHRRSDCVARSGGVGSVARPLLPPTRHFWGETQLGLASELTGFFPRIGRIFPSATSKRYLKG